jgi:hypothetical protein
MFQTKTEEIPYINGLALRVTAVELGKLLAEQRERIKELLAEKAFSLPDGVTIEYKQRIVDFDFIEAHLVKSTTYFVSIADLRALGILKML